MHQTVQGRVSAHQPMRGRGAAGGPIRILLSLPLLCPDCSWLDQPPLVISRLHFLQDQDGMCAVPGKDSSSPLSETACDTKEQPSLAHTSTRQSIRGIKRKCILEFHGSSNGVRTTFRVSSLTFIGAHHYHSLNRSDKEKSIL